MSSSSPVYLSAPGRERQDRDEAAQEGGHADESRRSLAWREDDRDLLPLTDVHPADPPALDGRCRRAQVVTCSRVSV